jgi:hypothetical protein
MVALNFQTNSVPVWLSVGKFSDNGGCGWLLKPAALRRHLVPPPPPPQPPPQQQQQPPPKPQQQPLALRIKVISGHYLAAGLDLAAPPAAESLLDPYVLVSISSAHRGDHRGFRTVAAVKNVFNPAWNQVCRFTVHQPELALLLFQVKDTSEALVGQACLPLDCLRPGYRIVPLRDADCSPTVGYLFCKVSIAPLGSAPLATLYS